MTIRRWLFNAEDENGDTFYLGGEKVEFIGHDHEANREADKRSDEWERANNGLIVRVVCESRGRLKTKEMEG